MYCCTLQWIAESSDKPNLRMPWALNRLEEEDEDEEEDEEEEEEEEEDN